MEELVRLIYFYCFGAAFVVFGALGLYLWWIYKDYSKSEYPAKSGCGYWKVVFDVGTRGEYYTFRIFEKENYPYLLCNVYLPSTNKKLETTEIDMLAVTPQGVVVVESKNYSGWIFGREKDRNWTQVIYRYKTMFYNPIKQNASHITALIKVLGDENETPIFSYIVFSQRCELKAVEFDVENVWVLKRSGLKQLIKKELENKERILSEYQMKALYDRLLAYCNMSEEIKQKHVDDIKESIT